MKNDLALDVLLQGAIAECVRSLRVAGKPEEDSDVRAAMTSSNVMGGHVQGQTARSLGRLVAEAKARISADLTLSRCDAELDAMERDSQKGSSKFSSLSNAADMLSATLRFPSSVDSYTSATNNAEAALLRNTMVLVGA